MSNYNYISILTDQQNRVAEQLLLCKSNKEIGETLGISIATVKNHIARLVAKTNAKNRTQLTLELYYIQRLVAED